MCFKLSPIKAFFFQSNSHDGKFVHSLFLYMYHSDWNFKSALMPVEILQTTLWLGFWGEGIREVKAVLTLHFKHEIPFIYFGPIRFYTGQKRRMRLLDGVTDPIVNLNSGPHRRFLWFAHWHRVCIKHGPPKDVGFSRPAYFGDCVLYIPCAGLQIEGIAALAAVPGCKF